MVIKETKFIIAGAAVALLVLVVLVKKKGAAADVGAAVGQAAVDAANGVVTGVVTGIGSEVGIPQTDMTECEKAMAEGRTWDASFACPASDFLGYVFN